VEKNKDIEVKNSEILKYFFKYYFSEKKIFFTLIFISLISSIVWNFYPIITKEIIDLVSAWNFLTSEWEIWKNFYYLIWIQFFILIWWRSIDFFLLIFEMRIMKKIFSDTFSYLNKHSYKFFSDNLSWSLTKKINRVPYSLTGFTDLIIYDFFWAIIWFLFLFFILIRESFLLFSISFSFLFLLIITSYFLQNWQLRYHKKYIKEDSKIWWLSADVITNNFNVSIFWAFWKEKKRFWKNLDIWEKAWYSARFRSIILFWVQWFLIILFEILITFFTLKMVIAWEMWIWTFVMIELFMLRLIPKFHKIWFFFKAIYRIFADAWEALQILKTPHEIIDIKNAKNLEVKKWEIEFKNVDFKYQDWTEVFKDFNLKIKPWEKVALVWESWAWKTSITQLIFRFFDIQWWEILIDWQNISKVKQDSLRKNISLVPQDPILFHRSLAENMKYWNEEISEEKFLEISKKTHCDDFISELEKWYDSMVWERWIKLSWWQRQRVAIARAIIENSKIFILDEATSALDSWSEKKVQEALEVAMKWKTSIVIAHRLSTIMKMDRIIVLDKWKIIEEWTHEELLKKWKKYKKFWEIQSGSFEK